MALSADGRLYTVGGLSDANTTLTTVETYEVTTGRWRTVRPLPAARQDLGVAAGPDGRIYAVGGTDSDYTRVSPPYATVDAYDPRTNRWQPVAPLFTARRELAAVQGADGRIYAIGGVGATSNDADFATALFNTVEAYGPVMGVTPHSSASGSAAVLTGANFAALATVSVTWGSMPGGRVLATGHTDRAGALLRPLRFHVPAGVRPGRYTVRAMDDRSRYPVTASLAVGVPASFGLAPTPLPLPTTTATAVPPPMPSPQTRYVAPQGGNAPDCTLPAAPCQTISYAVDQARDEDTLSVAAGVYSETVTLPVGLRLVGAGATRTVLDGGGRGPVVTTASGTVVTLTGMTLRNGTYNGGFYGGGIANPTGGQVGVSGSTISANTAGRRGGGFATANPTVPQVVTGTILAGNHAHDGGPDCAGTLTSGGGNLLGSGTGCTWLRRGHTADLLGTAAAPRDPLLGPLQDNGGSTRTQALLPGSPALDAIPALTAACPAGAQDQRGLARPYPVGGACDSGALEMRYP